MNASANQMLDLLLAKIRNAERALDNQAEMEWRHSHEILLVLQGWTPGPDWSHPEKELALELVRRRAAQ